VSAEQAASLFATFGAWAAQAANRAFIEAGDLLATVALVRRLDLRLRVAEAATALGLAVQS